MKSQGSKIYGHMVRGARINDPITRSGVIDYSVGTGCNEGRARMEETQVPRWIDDCTTEQSARLYHKFDNAPR